ncbi:hypothetical protein QE152_g19710 [Popillia japonica]|uniref:Uncharacterized protein n=1 Tax=Popillia japonica TaxID=7064 RepID=A0AAW1KN60_POPJA
MFLLLQKRPSPTYPNLSDTSPSLTQITNTQSPRQLVGGHLEATTYRPASHFPTILLQHQQQTHNQQQHSLVQRRINKPSSTPNSLDVDFHEQKPLNGIIQSSHGFEITQPPFVQPRHQIYQILPTNLAQIQQQPLLIQNPVQNYFGVGVDRVDINNYQAQQRKPVPYTPFNFIQQPSQEQIAYNNQLIQNRRFLEEQLSRQHNRFELPQNSHYQHFG